MTLHAMCECLKHKSIPSYNCWIMIPKSEHERPSDCGIFERGMEGILQLSRQKYGQNNLKKWYQLTRKNGIHGKNEKYRCH